uniref:hypothetical protein n=1 Tax=Altererythrobacter segetis TaxID=1104773 RepID=UPI001FAEEA98|nr:hypothetical protein [Altererythrobacter segetis]
MADSKKLPDRLTRKGGRAVRKALAKTRSGVEKVPGPSPNPATNVLIAEILVRSAGRLARRALEKGMLKARFEREQAVAIIEGRGLAHTLVTTTVARVATRSVPGALLVGGGLLAKTLFDRSISRRQAQRRGEKALAEQEAQADDLKL